MYHHLASQSTGIHTRCMVKIILAIICRVWLIIGSQLNDRHFLPANGLNNIFRLFLDYFCCTVFCVQNFNKQFHEMQNPGMAHILCQNPGMAHILCSLAMESNTPLPMSTVVRSMLSLAMSL